MRAFCCLLASERGHVPAWGGGWYAGASIPTWEETNVKKAMLLAMGAALLLAGCESKKQATAPAQPKWKGPAYRLAFDTKTPKPNPSGLTLPGIKWTANPDELETRGVLVVRYDSSGVKSNNLVIDQVILGATDMQGAEGQFSDDYIALADQGIAHLLDVYKVKGKVKVKVLLTRSSLNPSAGPDEIQNKAISDWVTTEVDYKGGKKK